MADTCQTDRDNAETAYLYCANEIYAGYACRVEGCPTCGGPEHADEVLAEIAKYMNGGRRG